VSDGQDELEGRIQNLVDRDNRTRFARAQRSLDVEDLMAEFPALTAALVGGGYESAWLFTDAIGCYIAGHFVAALVCAHGTCERELAGRVNALGSRAPERWEHWGLGALIKFASDQDWLTTQSQQLLNDVNRKRRDFYHFRDEDTSDSILTRTYAQVPWRGKEWTDENVEHVLRVDALQAIRAAFAIRVEVAESGP